MNKGFSMFVVLFCGIMLGYAQSGNISDLSIEDVMKGNGFIGNLPSRVQWSTNSNDIYFEWNPDNNFSDSLYFYNLKSKKIAKTDLETRQKLIPGNVIYNADKSLKLYGKSGDVYLVKVKTGEEIRVTQTLDRESDLHFTNNGTAIAFVRDKNIYTWDIATGVTSQVSNFTDKPERSERKRDPREEWLYQDQLELFDVLRERKEKEDARTAIAKSQEGDEILPIYIKDGNVSNLQISPDGNYITYTTVTRPKYKGTIVPHYVTESGYTEDQQTRSKVGDDPATYKMYVYDIKGKAVKEVSLENLEGLEYVPEYTKDYPDKPYENKDRIGYITEPVWSADGKSAVFDIMSNDWKDRWIVLLNLEEGKVVNLDHQHDEAWIAGPGIGGYRGGLLGWMPDNKSIYFMSEKTGYSHLYQLDVKSRKVKALTSGEFEIYSPTISKDKKRWYFTANNIHPGDRQFYSMPLGGGKFTQLTSMTGNNDVTLSPDEKYLAILYSFANKPTELYLKKNPVFDSRAKAAERITHSTTSEFEGYQWRTPDFITFKADDGAEVHARLYQPDAGVKNKAAVIFVHGAGYLQNAHKWWSSYYREYMFHNILVDNGFTVLDIDYRGSAGYGRDWRTGIYRHMGGKDLSDQVDGAEFLVSNYGIDKEKVGIYGGSYGGFITLMGMFNAPETFHAGAAIRSVGDWAAYNHGYTSRILNTPVADSLAYRRSSPIYFAEGLKGDLLILHGMVDDNVHFQDMVRLSQRLIELGKEDWEMAIYPVERHGFVEPSSWTDEYTRIFKLFRESLLEDSWSR